ncbi:uroporphyrinogen-III synthase [Roseibium sp.]|uniref:uroporphyrinogen-III synthase n=1 Tax=Roseibium sp. TaxID=1936156 RepID=UPI003BB14B91
MRLLVTRPEPDCRRTAERLRALGHVADEAPLLRQIDIAPAELDLANVAALAISSRRTVAVLTGHPQIGALRGLPVFAVGKATADAARDAGFDTVLSAQGDVAALALLILDRKEDLGGGRVLYPAATDRAGDLEGLLEAGNVSCRTVAIYRMDPVPDLPDPVLKALKDAAYDGILIYSKRTAEALAGLLRGHRLDHILPKLTVYALSQRAGAPLSNGMRVKVAAAPNENALLDLALTQC